MDGNLREFPKFFVFNSRAKSGLSCSIFSISYCYLRYSSLEFSCSEVFTLGLVMFSRLCFQMNMDNYPHVTIAEDGRLCSMGQHLLGFPHMLYDALLHLG
jgi:hypothetical protein